MRLLIVHYHFRPGGVRRVIEQATPHLIAHAPEPIHAVVLGTSEPPDPNWLRGFRERLQGVPVRVAVESTFGYAAALELEPAQLRRRIHDAVGDLLGELAGEQALVWAHNLGLGRNLCLAKELSAACQRRGIPLLSHHHDWWFENRWHHFDAMRRFGFGKLVDCADATFAVSSHVCHAAINHADSAILRRFLGDRAGWLPNPAEPAKRPRPAAVAQARAWLHRQLGEAAPVWLLPCRLMRRKNLAEALLLTRWLRPEAWLVTTGGVSSPEEQPYADALSAAAKAQGWRLRLEILKDDGGEKPSVNDLMSACETALLTSLQEGFGLVYLEAAAARRPLLARRLPNIAPDLERFGFQFAQSYADLMIEVSLLDWEAERARQHQRFQDWRRRMPREVARLIQPPAALASKRPPRAVGFSRLTLHAQLEVLSQPVEVSWARCLPWNPALAKWRRQAGRSQLEPTRWPAEATRWLAGCSYASRFFALARCHPRQTPLAQTSQKIQAAFLRLKLSKANLYPLLWGQQP